MNHIGTKDIETKNLLLRRYTLEDAEAMYKNWTADSAVTEYLTWPPHESVAVTKRLLRDWVSQYSKPAFYHWAITLKENGGEPIGDISVVHLYDNIAMAELGYCLGQRWWHKGITSEAVAAVIDYLFDEAGFNRISARHDPRNANSGKVMEKCAMKYEGTMRQADKNNQGICDSACYAIIASDRGQV